MSEHNPDSLTPDQVGVADGWRLLDEDEITVNTPLVRKIEPYGPTLKKWEHHLEGYLGNADGVTYRTRLSRAELRAARGLPPENPEDCTCHYAPLQCTVHPTPQASGNEPEDEPFNPPKGRTRVFHCVEVKEGNEPVSQAAREAGGLILNILPESLLIGWREPQRELFRWEIENIFTQVFTATTSEKDAEITRLNNDIESLSLRSDNYISTIRHMNVEMHGMIRRVNAGENTENCPFCLRYDATGHAQQSPQCPLCAIEADRDRITEELREAREGREAANETVLKIRAERESLYGERDALKTKLAESVKASFWEGYESYWRHHQLEFPITASEIVGTWEKSNALALLGGKPTEP